MQRWQWSVPANLLVAGEYAITSPGGMGVAVAVEPRATATVFVQDPHTQPGAALAHQPGEIVAHAGGGIERIYPDAGHQLAEAIIAEVGGHVGAPPASTSRGDAPAPESSSSAPEDPAWASPASQNPASSSAAPPAPQWRVEIDTTAFFDPANGTKQGLGSSAAAAILLTAALVQLGGRDPLLVRQEIIHTAISAHRAANGGRGSGYDIATSALGGVIRFVGGDQPQWRQSTCVHHWTNNRVRVFGWFSGTAVASSGAVSRFDRYVPAGSRERNEFLERNNAVIDRIEEATGWDDLFRAVSESRRIGEDVGASVGVPATIDICQPHRDDGWVVKASGAGNERAIILSQPEPRRSVPRQAAEFPVSPEGLRWEYNADRQGPER